MWETAAARRLLRRAPGREVPETVPKAEAALSGPHAGAPPARARRLKPIPTSPRGFCTGRPWGQGGSNSGSGREPASQGK